ncbi:hypothetical protein N431DRAFT_396440 [Stipitochalara longipes BDJ]|nr:hypothetical protein N431DRAFT_396440 [Stipitochalara longipes BDJ]
MDPVSALGVAAGAAGIISLGISVCDGLLGYYESCKNARADSARLYGSVERLVTNFKDLERIIQKPILKHTNFAGVENNITACKQGVDTLQSELERISGTSKSQHKFWTKARARAIYPFKEKTIQNLAGIVDRLIGHLGLAVSTLQLEVEAKSLQVISDVNAAIQTNNVSQEKHLTEQRRREITQWLSPPDPFSNYNAAVDKRRRDTGQWLLDSAQYAAWRESEDSFLWLHGFAGCGKTILTSTVIENTRGHCKSSTGHAIAVFYFDFNDSAKQQAHEMLCSLICQLYSQTVNEIPAIELLYKECSQSHKPGVHALLGVLRESISNFDNTFIVLDALDEATNREELLPILEKISRWELKQLHLLITSRREPDIEQVLSPLVTNSICIQNKLVDADIELYIHDRLEKDAKLSQWPRAVRVEIKATLTKGARGMFRWAVCQLDVLRKCLNLRTLREALKTLPEDLDETYVRILRSIDGMYRAGALRILQLLSYSMRPVTLQEVAETLAIDLYGSPKFDPDLRLREPRALLDICAGLITVRSRCRRADDYRSECRADSDQADYSSEEELTNSPPSNSVVGNKRRRGALHDSVDCAEVINTAELRFAHYSVKEFLVSERIRDGPMSCYYIREVEAHAVLAKCCLVFLLCLKENTETCTETSSIEFSKAQSTELLRLFPFMTYAAEYFSIHSRLAEEPPEVVQLCLAFFQSTHAREKRDLVLRALINRPMSKFLTANEDRQVILSNALYYSSQHGLKNTVFELIQNHSANVNGRSGNFEYAPGGTALHAAVKEGFTDIAVSLLDAGADIDAALGYHGTAICFAIRRRQFAIIQLLLARGANVNFQDENCTSPLGIAIGMEDLTMIELLLSWGAKVDGLIFKHTGETSWEILQLLVSHLEKINDLERFQKMGVALFSAGRYKNVDSMQLLLENGADIKASGLWSHETVLQVAACTIYADKIELLLSDIKARGLFQPSIRCTPRAVSIVSGYILCS